MKNCTKCKMEKDFSEFHRKTGSKDGLASWCKLCIITKAKQSYHSNHHKQKDRLSIQTKTAERKLLAIVNTIKSKYGCSFCPENDTCCLDFHHPNDDKHANVALLIRKKNKRKVFVEINKCLVVCANCHRKIHAKKLTCTDKPLCDEVCENYFTVNGSKLFFNTP